MRKRKRGRNREGRTNELETRRKEREFEHGRIPHLMCYLENGWRWLDRRRRRRRGSA